MKISKRIILTQGLFLDTTNGKVLIPFGSNHETQKIYCGIGQWECFRVSKKKKIKWWKSPDSFLERDKANHWKLVSFKLKDNENIGYFQSYGDATEELSKILNQIELFFAPSSESIFSARTVKKGLKRIGVRRTAKRYCTNNYPPLPYKQADTHSYSQGYTYV